MLTGDDSEGRAGRKIEAINLCPARGNGRRKELRTAVLCGAAFKGQSKRERDKTLHQNNGTQSQLTSLHNHENLKSYIQSLVLLKSTSTIEQIH
jgi:hypothetical protein